MKAAVFTVCIGESYTRAYEQLFKPSVTRYCEKHGYDLHVISDYITNINDKYKNPSFISFVKMMVPYLEEAKKYDIIMVLDADIIINHNTPPFDLYYYTTNKIFVVNEYDQPTYEERLVIQKNNNWEIEASDYYKMSGLDIDTTYVFNSGMFICKPAIHADFFRNLVDKYIDQQYNHPRGFHFEQSVFGYELQRQNMYHILDNKWNKIWGLYKKPTDNIYDLFNQYCDFYKDTYCLHMAGGIDFILTHSLNVLLEKKNLV
jgi:hypothetical protein